MKAILVIDIPNETNINELERMMKDGERASIVCNVLKIKQIPEKKDIKSILQYRGLAEQYRKEGWNECLDEIVGETE